MNLSDKTFKERARAFPQLEPLRQCRKTLAQLRLHELTVGADGRNRCLLSPVGTRTGRNALSNSKFIFGAAAWLRLLIRPPVGRGPAYIDWSAQVGIWILVAQQLLALHRATYRIFWRWAEENVARADLNGVIKTVYGWPMYTGPEWNPRAALNFPMQANGAEMMRIAAMLATEAGITVCAPIHDAFLIEVDIVDLESAVAEMREIMAEASRKVLKGFEIRTDVEIVRYADRYRDERGAQMWRIAIEQLEHIEAAAA